MMNLYILPISFLFTHTQSRLHAVAWIQVSFANLALIDGWWALSPDLTDSRGDWLHVHELIGSCRLLGSQSLRVS